MANLNRGKVLIFEDLIEGPPFWYSKILSNFISFFTFFDPENFMCLAEKVKKFIFWPPCLRGTLSSWYPQIWLNLIFPLYLSTLKILLV